MPNDDLIARLVELEAKATPEALKAVMQDFGVDACYCNELLKGECSYCLAKSAIALENGGARNG